MAAAVKVATFPFRALWRLFRFLVLPVGLGGVCWWVFALSGWAWTWLLVPVVVCALWALVMAHLWKVQMRGELRSLGRGTVHVDHPRRRRSRRGGRR